MVQLFSSLFYQKNKTGKLIIPIGGRSKMWEDKLVTNGDKGEQGGTGKWLRHHQIFYTFLIFTWF